MSCTMHRTSAVVGLHAEFFPVWLWIVARAQSDAGLGFSPARFSPYCIVPSMLRIHSFIHSYIRLSVTLCVSSQQLAASFSKTIKMFRPEKSGNSVPRYRSPPPLLWRNSPTRTRPTSFLKFLDHEMKRHSR
jgi:hypothetical protein